MEFSEYWNIWTTIDTNPVQQSLTLVNRRETVFSKGNSHPLFCHMSFSNDEQFSSKFFEETFFCVPNYIIISLANIGGRWLGHLHLVTHPDTNPVQQSLTLVNRREPVFSKGNNHQMFCYISFSNDEQFSSKFFDKSFFRSKSYNYFSPSDIPSNNKNNKFN